MKRIFLEIQSADHAHERVEVTDAAPFLLGRSRACTIRFSEPDVSGRHLELEPSRTGDLAAHVLSSRTTRLNGNPVTPDARLSLADGDVLTLGDAVTVRVSLEEEDAATSLPSDVPHADPEVTILPQARTTPPPPPLSDPDVTFVSQTEPERPAASVDRTMLMQTQMATPEELEKMRRRLSQAPRRKLYAGFWLLGVLVAILALGWFLSMTNRESVLTWPMTADGKLDDGELAPIPEAGTGFGLYFPRHAAMKIQRENPRHIVIDTRLGREQDVPFRLEFITDRSTDFVTTSRETTFRAWIDEQAAAGWNFGSVSKVAFCGRENGLPYQTVPYSRTRGNSSWFGFAACFKFRDARYILLKEIPASERWRGEQVLRAETCFFARVNWIRRLWDVPTGKPPVEVSPEAALAKARELLDANPAATGAQIEELIVSALARALRLDRPDLSDKAEAMLVELRRTKIRLLNEQKSEYLKAMRAARPKVALNHKKNAVHLFPNEEDQYYRLVRDENYWKVW